jgi:ribosomal subunit interface protein
MKVQIRGSKTPVTGALRAHIEPRLGLALGRFGERIGAVTVRFSRRGTECHCQISVGLRPREISVQDQEKDLRRAVDQASARIGSSVARAIEREEDGEGAAGSSWPGL